MEPTYSTSAKNMQKPRNIFFFERPDGSIIHAEENEAWGLYSRRQQILGQHALPYKLIGTGDGVIFHEAMKEAVEIGKLDLEKAKEKIRQGVNDELEACKGKIVPPRNMDKFGNGASFI